MQACASNLEQYSASLMATVAPEIREIELQQLGRGQGVDQKRHEPGANRAEKRRRVGRRVVQEHQHAVAALKAKRDQAVAPARGVRA